MLWLLPPLCWTGLIAYLGGGQWGGDETSRGSSRFCARSCPPRLPKRSAAAAPAHPQGRPRLSSTPSWPASGGASLGGAWTALGLAGADGVLDELRQSFSPGTHGKRLRRAPRRDSRGAALMLLVLRALGRRRTAVVKPARRVAPVGSAPAASLHAPQCRACHRPRRHPAGALARLGRLDPRARRHSPLGPGHSLDLHRVRPPAGAAQHRDGPLHARDGRAHLRGLHARRARTARVGSGLRAPPSRAGRLARLGAGRRLRAHRGLPRAHAPPRGPGRHRRPGLRDLPRSRRGHPARRARPAGRWSGRSGSLMAWTLGFLATLALLLVPWSIWRAVAVGFVSPSLPADRDVASTGCSWRPSPPTRAAAAPSTPTLTHWLRDKGFGMAGTIESRPMVVGGESVRFARDGMTFAPTEANLGKWRQWWRYLRTDFWYLWTAGCLACMALPALLAAHFAGAGDDLDGLRRADMARAGHGMALRVRALDARAPHRLRHPRADPGRHRRRLRAKRDGHPVDGPGAEPRARDREGPPARLYYARPGRIHGGRAAPP